MFVKCGMKISIITINFNGAKTTVGLLKSLEKQTDQNFQIIVIDNASEEEDFNGLRDYIEKDFSRVELIKNKQNLGFSGGNNVGIKRALEIGTEWVDLLNNDTSVETGFITSLGAKLSKLEAIVGLPLVEGDHTAYYGEIKWLKPTLKHSYSPLYADNLKRNTNNYAIGGGMAIHKDVFSRIGFLDEKYFLYFEDADFNMRASKAGITTNFIDEPKAQHQVSETTKKLGSSLLLRYHYRNSLYFNSLHGPWHIKLLVWPWSFWVIKKQLWKIMFMYKQSESLAILSGVFDFYRNKMGRIK
jgi:GT2 family glycosyltransferase